MYIFILCLLKFISEYTEKATGRECKENVPG